MDGQSESCQTAPGSLRAPEDAGTQALPRVERALRNIADSVVTLLVPGICRLCDGRLIRATDYPVCEPCLLQLRHSRPDISCYTCGEPLAPDSISAQQGRQGEPARCAACLASPPAFIRAVAYGLYEDLRPAIRLLKFEGVPALAKPLGALLVEAILPLRASAPSVLAVVPVPLFRGKRAYNQSSLLAEHALRMARDAAPGWQLTLRPAILRRTRPTESQFLLSPAQRRENLRGAFEANAVAQGLDVLLIDDVYTTGATAHECTRALLASGASSVHIATLARAGRDTAVQWRMAKPNAWSRHAPGAGHGQSISHETGSQSRRQHR